MPSKALWWEGKIPHFPKPLTDIDNNAALRNSLSDGFLPWNSASNHRGYLRRKSPTSTHNIFRVEIYKMYKKFVFMAPKD